MDSELTQNKPLGTKRRGSKFDLQDETENQELFRPEFGQTTGKSEEKMWELMKSPRRANEPCASSRFPGEKNK